MATNKYIQGLTRAGFRVPKTGGGYAWVKLATNSQVNVDDHATQLVLAGNRNTAGFIRVSGSGSTTATIVGLSRRGFRIKNSGGSIVTVKVGSGVHTVTLADAVVRRALLRNKRDWLFSASATQVAVRGIQNEQNGFYLKSGGTDVIGSVDAGVTNVANADTVVLGSKTYTFKTNLTEVRATQVLSSDGTIPTDGDTVVVNNITYRLKSTPIAINDIKLITSSDVTLDHLVLAVNGTGVGDGSDYFAGTVKPTNVTAAARAGTGATGKVTFTAAIGTGTAGNAFPSTETSSHLSYAATTFGSGSGAVAGVAPVANEVHIGGSFDASLTNLSEAINAGANVGVDYSSTTTANADATASAMAAHAITLTAVGGAPLSVAVTVSTPLVATQTTLNDSLVKVYRGTAAGATVTVDATNPFNYQQLRRHYDRWIEG